MAKTTEELLQQIKQHLPDGWPDMESIHQLHFLMVAADDVLKPGGNWILVDGNMTLKEALSDKQT